ncbi:MAG TPA: hypothetical protein VIL17_05305 [Coriobacteriia bacterium]
MTPDAIVPAASTPAEIAALFARFEVAMSDASIVGQSADGRYLDAYTAGFLLAKIAVRASGYRVKGGENHHDTFAALEVLMGSSSRESADALNAARKYRNQDMYDAAGMVDAADVAALLARVTTFEGEVRAWLAKHHPELLPA